MSWQGEITTIVRHLVNDVDPDSYTYSDRRLETAILVSAQIVLSEIDFENTYTVDVEQCVLTPDPTDPATGLATANKDDGFINLISLKTACLILGSEYKTQSLNAVRITDGPSSMDFSGVAANLKNMYDSACKAYEQYKFNLKVGSSSVGKAILSPYSPGADAVYREFDFYNGYFR
jgi:hypothetical protein